MTGVWATAKIMQSKTFQLAAAMNSTEQGLKTRRKMFYLSTSRIMANRYRVATGDVSVTLELNRDWFEQRYQAKPIDYWGRDWMHATDPLQKQSEKEERIYHDKPTIKMTSLGHALNAVHILAIPSRLDKTRDSRHIRTILIEAKRARLPVYYYTDRDAYYKGLWRKSVPVRQLIAMLEIVKEDHYYRSEREYTDDWRELFWKKSIKDLSEKAKKRSYKLVYNNYNRDQLRQLEADLHNNKNEPIQMRKMVMIWKKLKIHTIKDYHDYLEEKWKAIYEAEKS